MNKLKKFGAKFLKYVALLLIIILIIVEHLKIDFRMESSLVMIIVTELLPTALTILTIALSIPSEKVFGISALDFRRMRNASSYNFKFKEMIVIIISIFVLITTANILNLSISVWSLDAISVIYTVIFLHQEMPILLKDNDRLFKIVKKCRINNLNKSKSGGLSEGTLLYNVLSNILMKQGIKSTFQQLDDGSNDSQLLKSLIEINNSFLDDYTDREGYIKLTGDGAYYDIDIVEGFNISCDSFRDLISLNEEFNIIKIDSHFDNLYSLKRLYKLLSYLADQLSLTNQFELKVELAIMNLARAKYSNNIDSIMFGFKLFNYIVVSEASENKFKFLRLLRDSEEFIPLNNIYTEAYVFFVSIFFYYMLHVDSYVPDDAKIKLESFMAEGARGFNYIGRTWFFNMQMLVEHLEFEDLVEILPLAIQIFKDSDRDEPWYRPLERNSWSSADGEMNIELIMDCWIELLVYKHHMKFDAKKLDLMIDSFSVDDKLTLAERIYVKLLNDKNEYQHKENEGLFLKTHRIADQEHLLINKTAIDYLIKKHSDILKKYDSGLNVKKKYTEKDFNDYKNKFMGMFEADKKEVIFYDETLSLDDSIKRYIPLCLDISGDTDALISFYDGKFKNSLDVTIYKSFKKNITPTNMELDEINKLITEGKLDRYSGYLYRVEDKLNLDNLEERVNAMLPGLVLWKDGAIKYNALIDKNLTQVRRLNDSEINTIIERDYKVGNGLYRFRSTGGIDYAFLSRDEIYEVVKERFVVAAIVFDCKIEFNKDNIVWIENKKESK